MTLKMLGIRNLSDFWILLVCGIYHTDIMSYLGYRNKSQLEMHLYFINLYPSLEVVIYFHWGLCMKQSSNRKITTVISWQHSKVVGIWRIYIFRLEKLKLCLNYGILGNSSVMCLQA